MNTKACRKCGIIKELTEFSKNNTIKNGRANICKLCWNIYKRELHLKDPTKAKTYQKRHQVKHPNRFKARSAVGHAIRDGKLIPKPCEQCSNPKVQGHHDSYIKSKWLDVKWLCKRCHDKLTFNT